MIDNWPKESHSSILFEFKLSVILLTFMFNALEIIFLNLVLKFSYYFIAIDLIFLSANIPLDLLEKQGL